MMRGKWPFVLGLVLLIAVVGGVVVVLRNGARARNTPAAGAQPAAQTSVPAAVEVVLAGAVEARKTVNIPAGTDGIVARFNADVGEDVFEGELLAQIRNPKLENSAQKTDSAAVAAQAQVADLENALLSARLEASRSRADQTRVTAELERAQKTYEQQKVLNDQGATPRLTFEKAEKDYEGLKADAENLARTASAAEDRKASLESDLEKARKLADAKAQQSDEAKADLGAGEVHSPANGFVVRRHGKAGDAVSRDLPDLFQIGVELTNLQVTVGLDAKQALHIKPGQAAVVILGNAPIPIPGTVREMTTGQAIVDFVSPSPAVKPGQAAKVKLVLQ